jgi:tetratricopeptide (TPR) repeat protein
VGNVTIYEGYCANPGVNSGHMDLPPIDAIWDYDNPQATASKFKELLPIAEKSVDKTYYAELLTQFARTQSLQRKFDEAHILLDTARQVIEGQNMPIAEIRYPLERGRTFNSAGQKEQSIILFTEAYAKALEYKEDFYAIDAAHMLGIAAKPQDQLCWNRKAIDLAEKTTDARAGKWLGSLYNNMGWMYHGLKDYIGALTLFEKLLAWRIDQKDERGTFIAKWTVARTYRSLDRIDEALVLQMELLEEIKRKVLDPSGYVFEELAECLLIRDRGIEAKTYFKKAYEILSQDIWIKANEGDRLKRLKELGE